VSAGSSRLVWDGETLATALGAPGRRFRADPRCFLGDPVVDGWAHVCALPADDARLPYDMPEVQQVRRDALAWWIPLLGETLVCLTTLALDSVNYGGAVTVATDPSLFHRDPFARVFPGDGALRRRRLAGRHLRRIARVSAARARRARPSGRRAEGR
jgi:hypothetical protein